MLQGKLDILFEEKPGYDILLAQSYRDLSGRVQAMGLSNRKICVVTDSNVAKYHLDEVVECLAGAAGRVVTDLTGFAAATYLRGIRFFQLPTSLLSMVDSSIGGKTGVDFKAYKNMVGAFYMPQFVYMNISALKTLPAREYRSGFGEIIKHGLILDRQFYDWLAKNRDELLKMDAEFVTEMVYRSLLVKKQVVERDPKEKGERALLNFGHTLGHAVEKLKGFSLLHGECVSVGMAAALWLCALRGNLTAQEVKDIMAQLSAFGLPVLTDGLNASDIVKAALKDKKMDAGQIRFILLRAVGEAYADMTVTQKEMEQACEFHTLYLAGFAGRG